MSCWQEETPGRVFLSFSLPAFALSLGLAAYLHDHSAWETPVHLDPWSQRWDKLVLSPAPVALPPFLTS